MCLSVDEGGFKKVINMLSLRVSNYCPSAGRYLWLQLPHFIYTGVPSYEGQSNWTVPLSFASRVLTLHVVELTSVNGMLATHYTTLDIPVWVVLLWTCPVWTCKCKQFLLAVVNYYWCANIYRRYVRTYTITHLLLSLLPFVYLCLQLLNRKALFTTHLLWPS